jgi:predicted outer membrane protein
MAHVNPVQIQKYLKGIDYPASKAALLDKAKSMGADEAICASLAQLPDEDFQTPADVSQAFGKLPAEATGGGGKEGQPHQGTEHRERAHAGERKGEARAEPKEHARKEPAHAEPKEHARKEPAHAEPRAHAGKEPAHASHHDQPRYTGSNEFLIEAMQDAMAEIRVCELAIEKSSNHDVRVYAQAMIDEHGKMGREVEKLATDKKLDVPREIRPEQELTVEELSSLSGRDFEQRWIQYNIDVHERDIKVFRHYAGDESDADIKAMAKKHGDILGKHLKTAHELGKKLAKA